MIQKLWLFRPLDYLEYEIETGYVTIVLPRERRTLAGNGLLSGRMYDYLISQRKRVVDKLRSGEKGTATATVPGKPQLHRHGQYYDVNLETTLYENASRALRQKMSKTDVVLVELSPGVFS